MVYPWDRYNSNTSSPRGRITCGLGWRESRQQSVNYFKVKSITSIRWNKFQAQLNTHRSQVAVKAQQFSERFEAILAPIPLAQLVYSTNAVHGKVEGPHGNWQLAVSFQSTTQHRLDSKHNLVCSESGNDPDYSIIYRKTRREYDTLSTAFAVKSKPILFIANVVSPVRKGQAPSNRA